MRRLARRKNKDCMLKKVVSGCKWEWHSLFAFLQERHWEKLDGKMVFGNETR